MVVAWSASSEVSIDALRASVCAMHMHECQLRQVFRVGGQSEARARLQARGRQGWLVMARMRSLLLVLLLRSKKLVKEHQRTGV